MNKKSMLTTETAVYLLLVLVAVAALVAIIKYGPALVNQFFAWLGI